MEQSKKEFLAVLQGMKLSKTQSPTTAEDRKRMKSHSLCLSQRFYKVCYAVYWTYCIPCFEFGEGVQFDLGVDHWTAVKNILSEDYGNISRIWK